jgi:hypothetical protein
VRNIAGLGAYARESRYGNDCAAVLVETPWEQFRQLFHLFPCGLDLREDL